MNKELYEWIYSLLICGCMTSVILFLSPDDRNRTVIETGCSCVMFLALIIPLLQIDLDEYLSSLEAFSKQIEEQQNASNITFTEMNKELIEQKYAEYILNEAEGDNLKVKSVQVNTVENTEGLLIPNEVIYHCDSAIPNSFLTYIEEQLGVPVERQNIHEITGDHS